MIKITRDKTVVKHDFMLFPNGEVGVKIEKRYDMILSKETTIVAKIVNSNEVMELMLVADAYRRLCGGKLNLLIPYTPYCQQDRVAQDGEALSAKVFANLINSLEFNRVGVVDPHSDVMPALINNIAICKQKDIINLNSVFTNRVLQGGVLISPDAGSNKKIGDLANFFGHKEFIRADKKRDLTNGKIKETLVYTDDLQGLDCFIVDDICMGGRTFTELAKILKTKNCGKVILYVTHGFFTNGTKPLYEGGIDEIYTTDSVFENANFGKTEHILNIENTILM